MNMSLDQEIERTELQKLQLRGVGLTEEDLKKLEGKDLRDPLVASALDRLIVQRLDERSKRWATEEQNIVKRQKERAITRVKEAIATGEMMDLAPNEVALAKTFARARSFALMQQAFDTLEEIMSDITAKPAERANAAAKILERALGPATVPNGTSIDLSQLAPVEGIDLIMTEYNAGNCNEQFAKTMIDLLAAKVQGLKLTEIAARTRTINGTTSNVGGAQAGAMSRATPPVPPAPPPPKGVADNDKTAPLGHGASPAATRVDQNGAPGSPHSERQTDLGDEVGHAPG